MEVGVEDSDLDSPQLGRRCPGTGPDPRDMSGDNCCPHRLLLFFAFGPSWFPASTIGCKIRRLALMNLRRYRKRAALVKVIDNYSPRPVNQTAGLGCHELTSLNLLNWEFLYNTAWTGWVNSSSSVKGLMAVLTVFLIKKHKALLLSSTSHINPILNH